MPCVGGAGAAACAQAGSGYAEIWPWRPEWWEPRWGHEEAAGGEEEAQRRAA